MKQPIKITIPADAKFLSLSRKALTHLLSFYEVPEEIVRKIVLCVDEASSNIIKYSYGRNCDEPIEISYRVDGDVLEIQIRDYGKQCDPETFKPRELDDPRPGGLGTHFINALMDSVSYCTNREKGTLLTMRKKLGIGTGAPSVGKK